MDVRRFEMVFGKTKKQKEKEAKQEPEKVEEQIKVKGEDKNKKSKTDLVIVKELPTQELRTVIDADKTEIECMTTEEALREIILTLRELKGEK